MSNEIERPANGYTYIDPFEPKPALPTFPTLPADANTKVVAAAISKYLAEVADASIRTTYTTADTLDTAAERAAIVGGHMMVDVMGDNPIALNYALTGLTPPPTQDNLTVDFDATLGKIKTFVDSIENSWLTKYFPAALPNGLDPLLQMVTAGTIVTEAMQEIMWENAKAQTTRDARRARSEAVTQWASRGFNMPGGVVSKRLDTISQDLQYVNANLAAQQAIKALDIQVDAVKFAAEIGTRLQLGLTEGLTGLINAYSRLPSAATDYAVGITNAKRAAYSAINDYYQVLIENSKLALAADQTNAELHQRYAATAASFMGSVMSSHVTAAVNATDAYAKIAAQTLGVVNGVTQIGIESIS
jgi:hypothetical protein